MIKGIAHTAYFVTDMKAALDFYCGLLGLTHAFTIEDDKGEPWIEYLGFGNGQFIELFYGSTHVAEPVYDYKRIGYHHFCLETADMTALAKKLHAAGLMETDTIDFGIDGNRSCWVHDPDGNPVEIIQYYAESPLVKGAETPDAGIAHLALMSQDREKALRFYRDICGFPVQWTLDRDGAVWIYYLLVRPGQIIELYDGAAERLPEDSTRGGFHHMCIEVEDIGEAVKHFEEKGVDIRVLPSQGKDMNLQAWIDDPDGNKIELMQISPDSPQAKSLR